MRIWKTGGLTAKQSVLGAIGNTPLVRIGRLNPNPNVQILAKLEGQNPGGSVKDRAALRMVEEAEKAGFLTSDKTILEPSSGNTGIALAMIGAVKGYKVTIVMPKSASTERRKVLAAYGAELVLTPAAEKTDGAIRLAERMASAEPGKYFMPDQFSNPNNSLAHYESTALEIWEQAGGEIDIFVAAIGSGGTISGVGRKLRELNPQIRIIAAEPEIGHKIGGLKNMQESIVPRIFDESVLDGKVVVRTCDAIWMQSELAKCEGIFAGTSSGAALWASLEAAKRIDKGTIATLFPDRGEKYLSAGNFHQGIEFK